MPETHSTIPKLPPARHIEAGATTLAYFVAGPDKGKPLVLCHGLAASGLQFVDDAHWFAAKGYRVIVPDLRGHGRSVCPARRQDADFSIPHLARDLLAILDREKIATTDWVGNSLGGIVALQIMGMAPERLKHFISFGTAYRLAVPGVMLPALELGYKALGRGLIARLGAPMTCKGAAGQAIVHAMLSDVDEDAVVRVARHVRHYDLTDSALGFDRPILMIRGARDKAVNRALGPTLAAMENRPNFTLVDLPDAGHCANLDQPEKVRTIILEFLNR